MIEGSAIGYFFEVSIASGGLVEAFEDCDIRQVVNDFLATSANIMTIIFSFIPAITS